MSENALKGQGVVLKVQISFTEGFILRTSRQLQQDANDFKMDDGSPRHAVATLCTMRTNSDLLGIVQVGTDGVPRTPLAKLEALRLNCLPCSRLILSLKGQAQKEACRG